MRNFSSTLYYQLVRYPQEVIPTFDLAANELFNDLYPESILPHQIQVLTFESIRTHVNVSYEEKKSYELWSSSVVVPDQLCTFKVASYNLCRIDSLLQQQNAKDFMYMYMMNIHLTFYMMI